MSGAQHPVDGRFTDRPDAGGRPDGSRALRRRSAADPATATGPVAPGRRSGRLILGAIAAAALLGAGAAVALTPVAELSAVAPAELTSRPAAATVGCPGPLSLPEELTRTGGDSALGSTAPNPAIAVRSVALDGDSSVLFGTAQASTTRSNRDGTARVPTIAATTTEGQEIDAPVETSPLAVAVQTIPSVQDAARVDLRDSGEAAAVGDVVQQTTTSTGDFRSRSLTRCQSPSTSATFLGVGTAAGSTTTLVLHNDSDRPATASVQVFTADGPAQMEGRSRVVVPAHTTEQVVLESVVPGQAAIGVQVDTVGAPLRMTLQATEREGLTPRGAEILSAMPEPEADQILPGVVARAGGPAPQLVLMNRRGTDVPVTVRVLGPAGPVNLAAVSQPVTVAGGTVQQVTLEGLPPGDYSVEVTSAEAVDAVVRSSVAGSDLPGSTVDAPLDFAVATSAPRLDDGTVLALSPTGPDGRLVLSTTEATTATLVPLGPDGAAGEPVPVQLPADRAVTVPSTALVTTAGPAAALTLVPGIPGTVTAAWVQDGGTPESSGALLSSVTVRQRMQTGEGELTLRSR
ncbi:hypothetical protein JSY14_02950 [Brachybacterium sp. EF45031]|uniref:DUF5719 family protein n=1 Tax=Brachybacterium sillae TaxID=2810536 RepID=UPI00217DDE9D|nr:DUF5719 family protein [Brachybacterium sillae]MCS6711023.1 hypothetical protein [Brachybacterium sillae]